MKIVLRYLIVCTRKTIERIEFSDNVTFIHGPVSTGKSTIARLIDYCLGGELERTPAIQQEFIAATLGLDLGAYACTMERSANDRAEIRVTWSGQDNEIGSVNAPLQSQDSPLIDAEVYNFSDLLFHLCGVTPIKVRKRSRDPESPLIRLSFRDIWRYCYLDQLNLDSSFFRMEEPFRGKKSQDAMRFFTGLHSERLSQLESELMKTIEEQRAKRMAVKQIRAFMERFSLGSEHDFSVELQSLEEEFAKASARRTELYLTRSVDIHPTDTLRQDLRDLSKEINDLQQALSDSKDAIAEQQALRAELITTKIKSNRITQSSRILEGVMFERCPECGTDIEERPCEDKRCRLCGSNPFNGESSLELEVLRRDLNDRIDEITNSIQRRKYALDKMNRQLEKMCAHKCRLDKTLQDELSRYDSAFIESIRGFDAEIAKLEERRLSLNRLQQMPQAISELEEQAGALQGSIDRLRNDFKEEKKRLQAADESIAAIADSFKNIMLSVGFPGVTEEDEVEIDPRDWKPKVVHNQQEWGFWDTGSGGKKTLYNVCYALAIHSVAMGRQMPLPSVLIIDSPTKNISEDENPDLVRSLYSEIYRLATGVENEHMQFLLIDSDLVPPEVNIPDFIERRMAGKFDAPSLIPYYEGP